MFKLLFMEQSYKHIKVCALTFYLELNLCHLKPHSTPRIQASHKDIAYFKIYLVVTRPQNIHLVYLVI